MREIGQNIASCDTFGTMFNNLSSMCSVKSDNFNIFLGDQEKQKEESERQVESEYELKMCQVSLIKEGEDLDSFLSM